MVGPRSPGAAVAQEVRGREGGRRLASDGGDGDMEEMVAMVIIRRVEKRGSLSL